MNRRFVVQIGYEYYTMEEKDVSRLLAIAARSKLVRQNGYSGSFIVQSEQKPFVDRVETQDVMEDWEVERHIPAAAVPLEAPPPVLQFDDEHPF